MRRSLTLVERDLPNRPDEEDVEEDARRCRFMRAGSTFGILAATAKRERTDNRVE
jgi:hypothetical protein